MPKTIARQELLQLLIETARQFNAEGGARIDVDAGESGVLFGPGGALDSLGLVRFIVAVEQAIEERYGAAVTLTSESALSQRNSPFRTLGSLAALAAASLDGPMA